MISFAVLALLAAQQVSPQSKTVVRDSTRPDSAPRRGAPAPIRRPVTAALRESAFKDAGSRDLVTRARSARVAQDSSITSYDAKVAQRLSVKAAIGSVTMERLAFRQEGTARVQWQRGIGAHVDVTGARVSIPMLGMPAAERSALESAAADPALVPLPYFPGQEPLWVGQFAARPDVNENNLVNPLANGSEAYYTFVSGDVTTIRLINGDSIVVRQVDVRPREAAPNLLIGSLWLDNASGQVVRAAYRLAAPGGASVSVSNADSTGREPIGTKIIAGVMRALLPSMSAEVTDIVVEYQRVQNYWLPRSQVMEGFVKSSFARVPVTIENTFRFESVNETTGLAPFTVDTTSVRDSVVNGEHTGSLKQCKTSETRVVTSYRADSVPMMLRVPCDLEKLVKSPELPPSAFDAGEEIFGTAQRDALVQQALSMMDQAPFSWANWPMPQFEYGLWQSRYNRIEGLSTGIVATQQLGGGLDIQTKARIATADHTPRAELSIGRSNASKMARIGAFDRLVPATDWETPLSLGSSFSALFFGRDDAFYYRATGGELLWSSNRGMRLDWRAFSERQHNAVQKTNHSVSGDFMPNIPIDEGVYSGLAVRYQHSRGLDPRGFRTSTDIRLEGATGDSTYGRGSVEMTFVQGFVGALDGALTLGGGTTVGGLPIQRRWYLGGSQTIRGIEPSPSISGNAFWLTRAELGRPLGVLRISAFGDLGWAGDREKFTEVGRPFSGAGLGFSFFDGTLRLDVARGIYPTKDVRVSLYLGSRF